MRAYVRWLGGEAGEVGVLHFITVICFASILTLLGAALCIDPLYALWHGATWGDDFLVHGRYGRHAYRSIRSQFLAGTGFLLFSVPWLITAIAYWRGWLHRYEESAEDDASPK